MNFLTTTLIYIFLFLRSFILFLFFFQSDAISFRDAQKAEATLLLVQACIDPIETLFESMFMEDREMDKLLLLPGIQQVWV